MVKRILYLQPTFDIDLPRNIRTANIVEYLKKNYEVEILCFDCKKENRVIENVEVHRLAFSFLSNYIFNKTFSGYQPKGLLRFLSRGVSFLIGRFLFPDEWIIEKKQTLNYLTLQNKQYDVVIASMIPFSMGEIALELRKNNVTSKVIFDIGDPLSENAANIKDPKKVKKANYEKKLLAQADAIVVTNELTKKYYLSLDQTLPEHKISIVTQGVNEALFSIPKSSIFDLSKLKIIYAGIFYPGLREPQAFFEAIRQIQNPNIETAIYGETNKFGVEEEVQKIIFLPRIPQTELVEKYKKSNLILYIDNAYGIQTSGKIFELLMLKTPILMLYNNEKSPILEIVKGLKHVFIIKNNAEAIKQCLEILLKEDAFMVDDTFDTNNFTWANKANSFTKILTNI